MHFMLDLKKNPPPKKPEIILGISAKRDCRTPKQNSSHSIT